MYTEFEKGVLKRIADRYEQVCEEARQFEKDVIRFHIEKCKTKEDFQKLYSETMYCARDNENQSRDLPPEIGVSLLITMSKFVKEGESNEL
jgi:hypothetical protein